MNELLLSNETIKHREEKIIEIEDDMQKINDISLKSL